MAKRAESDAVLDAELSATLASALRPPALAADERARSWRRVAEQLAPPPAGTVTIRASDSSGWQVVDDKVSLKVLREDREHGNRTVLIRMAPGAIIVAHRHSQEEECLVLEGSIEIGTHVLHRGDMHIAQPGAAHAPITSRAGALLMIRAEIPPNHFSIV
jgi:quercetin dioxygenase-like cupin family protein